MSLVILGGGISGLLAGWVYREQQPQIFESSPSLGGTFAAGGLKYVRRTASFEKLLQDLHVPFSVYKPRGGMLRLGLMDGEPVDIVEHPGHLKSATPAERHIWQLMHWLKTRKTAEGFKSTCMNDPMGTGDADALAFDVKLMMDRIEKHLRDRGCNIQLNARATEVLTHGVRVSQGGSEYIAPFTRLLTTLPLPLQSKLAPWMGLPTAGKTTTLTIGFLAEIPQQLWALDGWKFDYIYTPQLKNIHRVSKVGGPPEQATWQVEAAGKLDEQTLAADFPDSSYTKLVHIPGHLLPLDREPIWPRSVAPIGRFAEWDSRAEACTVLERAENLLRTHW